jgi:DNA-binding transcriptional LysR family regulator
MEAANVHCNARIQGRYAATAGACGSGGLGVSVVDPFAVRQTGQEGLMVRPFRPRIPYEFSVVLAAWRPRSRLVEDFVTIVHDHLARDFGAS